MPRKQTVHKGQVFPTLSFGDCKVLKYNNFYSVVVKFLNTGTVTTVDATNLRKGLVRDPMCPNLFGIGYIGIGEYSSKDAILYTRWKEMLSRINERKFSRRRSVFFEVSVTPKWLNFQNFAAWCVQQPNWDDTSYHLDKDLRVIGKKRYAPRYCSFVPLYLNSVMANFDSKSGPRKTALGYITKIKYQGISTTFGPYATEEKARRVYRKHKNKQLRMLANQYRDVIHPQIYANLMDWPWEILDGLDS